MFQDLRHAWRSLLRAPGFAATAVVTLALGLGANTAIFTIVYAVLLEPLPYLEPERLVRFHEGHPGFELNVSYPNFLDWRARSRLVEDMAIYNPVGRVVVSSDGPAEAVPAARTEARLFTLLGVPPIRGRVFTPDEEKPGAPPVALISYRLWQRRFGGSDSIVGRAIDLGDPVTVVGVLPADFTLNTADVWQPMARLLGPMQLDRGNHPGFQAIGRLRAGATVERARQEMSGIAADLERQYPISNHEMGIFVRPLLESVVGRIRPMLQLLTVAVGCLLLIACANLANVLLARGLRRDRETAVRAALGARRARLVRLFLCEGLVIALAGGALGMLVAAWSVRAFLAVPGFVLPRAAGIAVGGHVFAFAIVLSFVTAVVCAIVPALQLSQVNLMTAIRQTGGSAGVAPAGTRLRGSLIAMEVALSLMLLVGAGLMARTLARLAGVTPGYRPEGLLVMRMRQGAAYSEPTASVRFTDRLVDELTASPGISAAAATWPIDLVDFGWTPYANFADRPFPRGQEPPVQMAAVTPSYFATMGIPLKRGRLIAREDRPGAPVVVVVNETLVRRFLPVGNPIGRHLSLVNIPQFADAAIVGVVGDTLRAGLTGSLSPEVYAAYAQFGASDPAIIVRAVSGDPLRLARTVEDRIAGIDRGVATFGAVRVSDALAGSIGDRRMLSLLLGVFAVLALALTSVGLAGVVAYSVAQRTWEIGVRMALGADAAAVVRTIVAGVMAPVGAGLLIGVAATVPFTRIIQRFLFGVSPLDPAATAGAAAVLLGAAVVAAYVPARRATRIDPLVALRE